MNEINNKLENDFLDTNKAVEELQKKLKIDLGFLKIRNLKKYKFEDFVEAFEDVKKYKHCEAIIHRNGLLSWASPSHQKALISISGKSENEIWEMMPVTADALRWLLDFTGAVAVWPEFYISSEKQGVTLAQQATINKLIKNDLLRLERQEN